MWLLLSGPEAGHPVLPLLCDILFVNRCEGPALKLELTAWPGAGEPGAWGSCCTSLQSLLFLYLLHACFFFLSSSHPLLPPALSSVPPCLCPLLLDPPPSPSPFPALSPPPAPPPDPPPLPLLLPPEHQPSRGWERGQARLIALQEQLCGPVWPRVRRS